LKCILRTIEVLIYLSTEFQMIQERCRILECYMELEMYCELLYHIYCS